MGTSPSDVDRSTPRIAVEIPPQDTRLFGSKAVNDILVFLSRYHKDWFAVAELSDTVGYTRKSISNALDVLENNELVLTKTEARKRAVRVNPDRLDIPDNPYFQIPQSGFRQPVEKAVEMLVEELEGVVAVVVYGSVARGEADRRSDVDLWVLVADNRMRQQRAANEIRQKLEEQEFGENRERYHFDIDVEAVPAIPNYLESVREILSDGVVLHQTEEFGTVQSIVLHGDDDE